VPCAFAVCFFNNVTRNGAKLAKLKRNALIQIINYFGGG
jgi:hypothetical protein